MQQLFKFVIHGHHTRSHKIVSYTIKYNSLLKGSATSTSIKIINSTVKQNLICRGKKFYLKYEVFLIVSRWLLDFTEQSRILSVRKEISYPIDKASLKCTSWNFIIEYFTISISAKSGTLDRSEDDLPLLCFVGIKYLLR